MGLPCLEDYYRAAQIRYLICWCDPTYEAKWKTIEQNLIKIPLPSLIGDINLLNNYLNKLPSWVTVPLNIWKKLLKDTEIEQNARILRWIIHDTEFIPAKLDNRFKYWRNSGITSFSTITNNKGLLTFQQLRNTFNLEKYDFFRYLQLRHYYNKNIKWTTERGLSVVKVFMEALKGNAIRKLISKTYTSLQLERGHSTAYVKTRWEREANIKITEEDWLNICKTQSSTSSSGLWREFIWKNILRFFITPKIKGSQTNKPELGHCWRMCGNTSAGHFHIFWECPALSLFWENVIKEIRLILGSDIEFSFSLIY